MHRPLTVLSTEKQRFKESSCPECVPESSFESDCQHPALTSTIVRDDQTRAICIAAIFSKLFCLLHLIAKTPRFSSEIDPIENGRARRGCRIS